MSKKKLIYEAYIVNNPNPGKKTVVSQLFLCSAGYEDESGKKFRSISQWRRCFQKKIAGIKFRRIKE